VKRRAAARFSNTKSPARVRLASAPQRYLWQISYPLFFHQKRVYTVKNSLLAATLLFLFNSLSAQPGTLDASFGNSGITVTPIGFSSDLGWAIDLLPNGKVVQVGQTYNGTNSDFGVVRYDPDGVLDSGFGNNGTTSIPVGTGDDYARALVVQSDQKMLIGGQSVVGTLYDFTFVRLLANGDLDPTFGQGGTVTVPVGDEDDDLQALAILPDGKILATGLAYHNNEWKFALLRLKSNGDLDNTFGTNGKVLTSFTSTGAFARGLVVQSDGKIVVAGESNNNFAVARYLANGTLDNTFGQNGQATFDFGGIDRCKALALQNDGKLLLVGSQRGTAPGSTFDFAVVRLLTNGTLDPDFGIGGLAAADFNNSDDEAFAIVVQNDGKIVLGGEHTPTTNSNAALVRFNANGTVDSGFGTNGRVVTAIHNDEQDGFYSLVLQSSGRIVAGGWGRGAQPNLDFVLAGYDGGGSSATQEPAVAAALLYPNPASGGQFFVKNARLAPGRYECRVTDLTGRLLHTQAIDLNGAEATAAVQLPAHLSGCWVVELSQQGRALWRERLVVVE
jgi:uncharacterized delta-60 repeat protein